MDMLSTNGASGSTTAFGYKTSILTYGQHLKNARMAQKMSQQAVADLLPCKTMPNKKAPQMFISLLERDLDVPSALQKKLLDDLFDDLRFAPAPKINRVAVRALNAAKKLKAKRLAARIEKRRLRDKKRSESIKQGASSVTAHSTAASTPVAQVAPIHAFRGYVDTESGADDDDNETTIVAFAKDLVRRARSLDLGKRSELERENASLRAEIASLKSEREALKSKLADIQSMFSSEVAK